MVRTRPCTCTVYTACTCTWPCRVHGRAMYTVVYTGRVHGHVRAVYTCTRPCTRFVYGRVHGRAPFTARIRPCNRHVRAVYTCIRSVYIQPYTRSACTVVYGPCPRPCRRLCTGRVHTTWPCTWPVNTACTPHTRPVYETYRIFNFLTNCCDYICKQSKAPYCLSPEVY